MKINKRTSHFLDLSRAASAFLVLIGHIHMVLFVDIEKSKLFSVGSFFNFISSYAASSSHRVFCPQWISSWKKCDQLN